MDSEFPVVAPRPKLWPTLTACVVATALIVGGGVYLYQKHQQDTANQDLQAQIDSLKSQLAAQATPTPTATPVASPTPTGATPTPTATPIALCTNLTLSLLDNGGGTAGTYYTNVVLTNAGSTTCTLMGYPNVSLLDAKGAVLGTAANTTSATAATITLTPNKAAYAAVGFPNAGNFEAGTCSAAATNLSVTPPGATTPLLIATTRPYCPGFSVSAFSATKL